MGKSHIYISFVILLLLVTGGCSETVEHTAPAVRDRDSLPMMVTYGVNAIFSDSGVQKYRVVAERWEVNTTVKRQMYRFSKGLFLSQFNDKFEVVLSFQADTAYYYNQERLWELRGRVRIVNEQGLRYIGEELFWDQNAKKYYSNKWSKVITPERILEGDRFISDERMTNYHVWNAKGEFQRQSMIPSDTTKRSTGSVGGSASSPMFEDNSNPYRIGESPTPQVPDTVKQQEGAVAPTEDKQQEENKAN